MSMPDVRGFDPRVTAPPTVVVRDPARDVIGHGRTIPLVGGERPYLFDVVFKEGSQRVYADTPGDVLGVIIDGYAPLVAAERAAQDRDANREAFADAYLARYDHAVGLRPMLQARINAEAQASGAWDSLDAEEQQQCQVAADPSADADPPVGVLYTLPVDAYFAGEPGGTMEQGFWTTRAVKLVINRGDYGILDKLYSEPQSWLEIEEPDGGRYTIEEVWPENMVILDPTTDELYLESLSRAGIVDVRTVPTDLPDELYETALAAGWNIA